MYIKLARNIRVSFWSLSKNFIENFGIPSFTKTEEKFILNNSQEKIDNF